MLPPCVWCVCLHHGDVVQTGLGCLHERIRRMGYGSVYSLSLSLSLAMYSCSHSDVHIHFHVKNLSVELGVGGGL